MKRLILGLLALVMLWAPQGALAQSAVTTKVFSSCGSASYTAGSMQYPTQNTTGQACTSTTPTPSTTAGMSTLSAIVANNTTSVAVKASAGTLYAVRVFNNSTTLAYLKLYDASQGSTTCGSGTPVARILIPAATSGGAGAVINVGGGLGVAFSTAITRCVTTGIADNDTGAPAATSYIVEFDYK